MTKPRGICKKRGCPDVVWTHGLCSKHRLREERGSTRTRPAGAANPAWKGGTTSDPLYHTWHSMKKRCYYTGATGYANYGGRGITVCDEWRNDFWAFKEGVGACPSPDMSLDRIDVDGNYESGNVRWATAKEQQLNRRRK
jgi:hypothetical protein